MGGSDSCFLFLSYRKTVLHKCVAEVDLPILLCIQLQKAGKIVKSP